MRAQNLDDHKIASLLAAAKWGLPGSTVAEKVEELLLSSWTTEKKSADDVFKLLQLKNEGETLFKDPSFSRWVSYVRSIDEKNADTHMYTILRTAYGDDELAPMLVGAKKSGMGDEISSVIAGKIEAIQLEKWLSDGKTAVDVFKLLKIENAVENAVWNPRTRMWVDYVTELDSKNADDVIFTVLKSYYSDEKIGEMIQFGWYSNADIAERLANTAIAKWRQDGKTADNVFDFLLKDHHRYIFETRDIHTWVSYVTKMDKESPYKTMFEVLQKRFDEKQLGDMLYKAEKVGGTRDIAVKLELELWLSQKKSATGVFTHLNLASAENELFTRSSLPVWISYVTKLAKMDEEMAYEEMLSVLTTIFSNKRLERMQTVPTVIDGSEKLAAKLNALLFNLAKS
ncbi:hypothetical protein PHYSODRAFT_526094 [Phytophthora sojae]|uniref:RxLR effector PexRD54 WY domain-containing protein n=1 Tax=Phytophthora sojae (strain P6497) TaxID=1094619 RepID=G5A7K9_PHYSP|nr:hypothetical protein PHYSODRAFT_526094 [Phytophthora sojae]EGZ07885.1 hypothetical protein PHYSODRAFT_526094 [Phytophthora sojae]|eukprot:XP_009536057.1 hypothetical protein PHYSODRAFT_526094 [Phytophthora sojae]